MTKKQAMYWPELIEAERNAKLVLLHAGEIEKKISQYHTICIATTIDMSDFDLGLLYGRLKELSKMMLTITTVDEYVVVDQYKLTAETDKIAYVSNVYVQSNHPDPNAKGAHIKLLLDISIIDYVPDIVREKLLKHIWTFKEIYDLKVNI